MQATTIHESGVLVTIIQNHRDHVATLSQLFSQRVLVSFGDVVRRYERVEREADSVRGES